MPPLRLALLGAFAFPAGYGSQRYAADQAEALRAPAPRSTSCTTARLRGFDPSELAADRALGHALLAAHRTQRCDAVLAHNAGAARCGGAAGPPSSGWRTPSGRGGRDLAAAAGLRLAGDALGARLLRG
jgi:hypothetical protein